MLHTFMTTQPFKLHFTDTEQYFLRPPVCCRSRSQIHGSLSLVLIHLTMANLLLSIHRFTTNDCRGSGPRRRCLSSSTVSRRPSFASIWGLHSYPSCLTFVDSHFGFEVDVDIWTSTMASTSFQLDEKVADLLYRRGPGQPLSSSLARRVRVQLLPLSPLLFVRGVRPHRHLDLFKGPWPLL